MRRLGRLLGELDRDRTVVSSARWRRNRAWSPGVEAAAIVRRARLYDLRSTFASDELHAGIPIRPVEQLVASRSRRGFAARYLSTTPMRGLDDLCVPTGESTPAIRTSGLLKDYGAGRGLLELDLKVERGVAE